ncbi:MAG: hypothetical protein AB1Z57_08255 [Acidimicrobiia bacterium]
MRVTERRVLLVLTAAFLVVALGLAAVQGELAGFEYPGSQAVFAIALALSGAVVLGGHPGHTVGRLLMWAGLVGAVGQLAQQLDTDLDSAVLFAGWGLMLVAIARFPDGEWVSGWSKWMAWGMLAAFAVQAIVWVVAPLVLRPEAEAAPPAWVNVPIGMASVLGFLFVVATVAGMWRLVRGDPVRSRQVGVVVAAGVVIVLLGLLARPLENAGYTVASGILNALSALAFPIGVVVAITRYRLYEIDRLVSRTISYAIVLGAMAAVYVSAVTALSLAVPDQEDLTVAIATLVAVAVSVPLVGRMRRWVDRRFFRSRYDAGAVVARVAAELRETVDLAEVEFRAESVIDEVFAPESVEVWVAEEVP